MNAYDLLKQSQAEFVLNENLGISQEVDYIKPDGTTYKVRCFVAIDNYQEEDDRGRKKADTVRCENMVLTEPPTQQDKIIIDSEEYRVDVWVKNLGLYAVTAVRKEHTARRFRD